MTTTNAALLAAALLFVLFVVGQALLPAIVGRGRRREAHARLSAAVARGTDAARAPAERASALRQASEIALAEIRKPRLAIRYAHWADRASPGDAETIAVLARAMTVGRRYRALERLLWRTIDEHDAARETALDALLALYDGPMRLPERARVLRALRARSASASTPV